VFTGELGLAPSWLFGTTGATDAYLDPDGMEAVSACLMAFTNGRGVHVHIEMNGTGRAASLGKHDTSSTNWFKYQEAAFFGNLFVSPPTGAYCVGKDYAGVGIGGVSMPGTVGGAVDVRACAGYGSASDCPYKNAGRCEGMSLSLAATTTPEIDAIGTGVNPTTGGFKGVITSSGVCNYGLLLSTWTDPTSCTTGSGLVGGGTTWKNVVYTYRLDVADDVNNAM
jgi:hypothetical protein